MCFGYLELFYRFHLTPSSTIHYKIKHSKKQTSNQSVFYFSVAVLMCFYVTFCEQFLKTELLSLYHVYSSFVCTRNESKKTLGLRWRKKKSSIELPLVFGCIEKFSVGFQARMSWKNLFSMFPEYMPIARLLLWHLCHQLPWGLHSFCQRRNWQLKK